MKFERNCSVYSDLRPHVQSYHSQSKLIILMCTVDILMFLFLLLAFHRLESSSQIIVTTMIRQMKIEITKKIYYFYAMISSFSGFLNLYIF